MTTKSAFKIEAEFAEIVAFIEADIMRNAPQTPEVQAIGQDRNNIHLLQQFYSRFKIRN
jgi:hypothetical protein